MRPLAFLVRKQGKKVRAHIWLGRDTACRMWSTGGLKQSRFEVRDQQGEHEICHMCKAVSERREAA